MEIWPRRIIVLSSATELWWSRRYTPTILSITGAGTTNVVITWSALSNAIYRVWYSPDLGDANWQSLIPDVTATNNTASITDAPPVGVMQRFYRVLVP